jgi:hypothetical protein
MTKPNDSLRRRSPTASRELAKFFQDTGNCGNLECTR